MVRKVQGNIYQRVTMTSVEFGSVLLTQHPTSHAAGTELLTYLDINGRNNELRCTNPHLPGVWIIWRSIRTLVCGDPLRDTLRSLQVISHLLEAHLGIIGELAHVLFKRRLIGLLFIFSLFSILGVISYPLVVLFVSTSNVGIKKRSFIKHNGIFGQDLHKVRNTRI